jgi:PAS domain S-box-containing protein
MAQQHPHTDIRHTLQERVKELTCLHKAAQLLQSDIPTEHWIRELTLLLPPAWQYPEITAGRIAIGDTEYSTPGFRQTPWMQRAHFTDTAGRSGVIEIAYLKEKPPLDEGPFLHEERNLINSLAEILCTAINRRCAEEALHKSRRLLASEQAFTASLMDTMPAMVVLFNDRMQLLKWNKVLENVTGYTQQQIAEMSPLDFIHPEDHARAQASIQHALHTGAAETDLRIHTGDGRTVPYLFHGVRQIIDGTPCILTTGLDISLQIATREALTTRNNLYAMLAATNRAVSRCRSTGELFQEICRIAVEVGHFKAAWVGVPAQDRLIRTATAGEHQGYLDNIHISLNPNDPRSQGPSGRCAATAQPQVVNDFLASPLTSLWHTAAAKVGIAASAAFPLMERGRVGAVLTLYAAQPNFFTPQMLETLTEITPSVSYALDTLLDEQDRRYHETELRLRDRAIRAASQGILITDASLPDNPVIYASPAAQNITGYTPNELIGRNCRMLQGPETDPQAVERIREAVRCAAPITLEILNYRKDGTTFWNELSISPVRDDNGNVTNYVGVLSDVTNRRLLEAQLRQSQKMESFGQLAGGVAHDFNNLLTVIFGCGELLIDNLAEDPASLELARQILTAAEHAASLTRQLLAFSRQSVVDPKILNLNHIIHDTIKMLRRLIGEDIRLNTNLDPHLSPIRADAGHITQVLLNLAVNARDAMPRGGTLTVTTRNTHSPASASQPAPTGRYILLEVSDTGTGMPPEVLARIFEPFYTTKGIRKGTGLGLAVVHGIVQQCGGTIHCESSPQRGTTFTLCLPAADAQPEAPGTPARGTTPQGSETILITEDEETVRQLAETSLRRNGYNVLSASSGPQALAAAHAYKGDIHLLITDVIMPEMGGWDLMQQLRTQIPHLKVLFVSGYTDDAVLRQGVLQQNVDFLQKPFSPNTLLQKVRSVLDPPAKP